MPYSIVIFNQRPLGRFTRESLLAAITVSKFSTLCVQYGLDPALIQPALDHLAVDMAVGGQVPYFMVRYQPGNQPPIVVSEQEPEGAFEQERLMETIGEGAPLYVWEQLSRTRAICSVELVEPHLADLGLLLGYELARWAAASGDGVVLGLDGIWYRLNVHHAFIPLGEQGE